MVKKKEDDCKVLLKMKPLRSSHTSVSRVEAAPSAQETAPVTVQQPDVYDFDKDGTLTKIPIDDILKRHMANIDIIYPIGHCLKHARIQCFHYCNKHRHFILDYSTKAAWANAIVSVSLFIAHSFADFNFLSLPAPECGASQVTST